MPGQCAVVLWPVGESTDPRFCSRKGSRTVHAVEFVLATHAAAVPDLLWRRDDREGQQVLQTVCAVDWQ